ncbi:MAG: hypothetical protein ABIJ65_01140 [Chloroflexota bacterium]
MTTSCRETGLLIGFTPIALMRQAGKVTRAPCIPQFILDSACPNGYSG